MIVVQYFTCSVNLFISLFPALILPFFFVNLSPFFSFSLFLYFLRRSAFDKNPEVLARNLMADEEIGVDRNNYKKGI